MARQALSFSTVRNASTCSSSLFVGFGYPGWLVEWYCAGGTSGDEQWPALIFKPFVPWFRWLKFWNGSDSFPTNVPVINSVAHVPCMVQPRRKAVHSRRILGKMHIHASSAAPRATRLICGRQWRKRTCTPRPSTSVRNSISTSRRFVNGSSAPLGCPMQNRTEKRNPYC